MGGARGAGLAPLRFLDPDLGMVQRPQCLALIGNADNRRVAENEWRPQRNIYLGIIIIDVSKSIQTSQGKPLQSIVLITRCTDGLLVQTLK